MSIANDWIISITNIVICERRVILIPRILLLKLLFVLLLFLSQYIARFILLSSSGVLWNERDESLFQRKKDVESKIIRKLCREKRSQQLQPHKRQYSQHQCNIFYKKCTPISFAEQKTSKCAKIHIYLTYISVQ